MGKYDFFMSFLSLLFDCRGRTRGAFKLLGLILCVCFCFLDLKIVTLVCVCMRNVHLRIPWKTFQIFILFLKSNWTFKFKFYSIGFPNNNNNNKTRPCFYSHNWRGFAGNPLYPFSFVEGVDAWIRTFTSQDL